MSAFHGTEDTILYPSCFDANAGFFEAILTKEDAVISDALNHASIIDGIRLCKAERYRYRHMDIEDLERCLMEARGARTRWVVTDGVFSMDGDVAPLADICRVAEAHDAHVFVDECHATGCVGRTGRGTVELEGVAGRVDVVNSTLGKALGGASGGFTTGRADVIEALRQRSRPYLFSNSVAPPLVGAAIKALDLIEAAPAGGALLERLRANAERFRREMTAAGFDVRRGAHPIVPVMLGDAALAGEMARRLLRDHGVYVVGFSYPVVPMGAARIRVQLSAAHTEAQVGRAVAAFTTVGRELGVVPS